MKNTLTALHRIKIYKPRILVILILILLLSLFSQITPAQDETAKPQVKRPYKLPPNLMQYFKGKYVHIDDFLISTIQETPDGPLGGLTIRGNIKPKAEITVEDKNERARAIALAFFAEEADILDITNIEELREAKIYVSKGLAGDYINVYYQRYIGDLPLSSANIKIEVTPDGKIGHVDADLVPTPPELYEAVKKETLSKEQIIKIIERDLASPSNQSLVKIFETNKVATWRQPYVVWVSSASVGRKPAWAYTIDAFTGEILNKGCTAKPVWYDPNFNPCK